MSDLHVLTKTICRIAFSIFLIALPASGFAAGDHAKLNTEDLLVQSAEADHRFLVEVAATDRERARGLMFREEMAIDHGMLFVFESEGQRHFWMKNTPLSLDIIYINAAGQIVSISAHTTPYSESVIPSGKPARYVLELNAGTSEKLGIDVGDVISSPSMEIK
ncbi:hypothetical protein LP7551_02407 [Roseibium album]|nr:hypothetical protein LP7551_02407 [Roseibium album]